MHSWECFHSFSKKLLTVSSPLINFMEKMYNQLCLFQRLPETKQRHKLRRMSSELEKYIHYVNIQPNQPKKTSRQWTPPFASWPILPWLPSARMDVRKVLITRSFNSLEKYLKGLSLQSRAPVGRTQDQELSCTCQLCDVLNTTKLSLEKKHFKISMTCTRELSSNLENSSF